MPDRHIEVSVDDQSLTLFAGPSPLKTWPISTAERGVGFAPGSFRTPTGNFQVCEKIGAGAPLRTHFVARQAVGIWDSDQRGGDGALTRILRLDGLDPENDNTLERFIYIHGTNEETLLGTPASHGCVRMANLDVIDLFERVEVGDRLIIHPPQKRSRKLIFFDCDSTLSSIEGIDELARAAGPEIFHQVQALTNDAMDGRLPLEQVYARRLDMIRTNRALCESVARLYIDTIVPGAREALSALVSAGWTPIILSGGLKPLIEPLAGELQITQVEAVPLYFHSDGTYAGHDADYPTTRSGGKAQIIREWKQATLPARVIMVGDGISDLEARPECDLFIAYGGVVDRETVRQKSDLWIDDMGKLPMHVISENKQIS